MSDHPRPFRPVQYLGSKAKYLDAISEAIADVAAPGSTALDLFAGSGIVAQHLALSRPVIANDIQSYTATLIKALTSPTRYSTAATDTIIDRAKNITDSLPRPVFDLLDFEKSPSGDISEISRRVATTVEYGSIIQRNCPDDLLSNLKRSAEPSLRAINATITLHYGGPYFSYSQSLALDSLAAAINHEFASHACPTLVASMLYAASNTASTVGSHFAQPPSTWSRDGAVKQNAVNAVMKKRRVSVYEKFRDAMNYYRTAAPSPNAVQTTTADFSDSLTEHRSKSGVVYADPPYTRDHYSRFYHVLETIARADSPGVSLSLTTQQPTRGLYRADRHQSPFSIRTLAKPSIEHIMRSCADSNTPLVLSYSPQGSGTAARPETRLVSIGDIETLAARHFSSTEVRMVDKSSHSRFNKASYNGVSSPVAETLFLCK